MSYKPKINDIVMIKHSNTLGEITRVHQNDVSLTILKCHVIEREKERGHLALISDLKLIWRRKCSPCGCDFQSHTIVGYCPKCKTQCWGG